MAPVKGKRGGAKAPAAKRSRKASKPKDMKVVSETPGPEKVETFLPTNKTDGPAANASGTGAPIVSLKERKAAKAAEAAAAEPATARAEHYRELVCALTDAEVARKSNEMAAAVGRRHEIEAERREYAGRTRADLKGLTGQVEQLAEQVRSRAESRPVRCKTVSDTDRKKVAVFRLDTMECLDVRDMSESEAARAREEPPRQLGADAVAAIRAWERDRGKFARAAAEAQAAKEAVPPVASPGFSLTEVPGLTAASRKALELAEYGTLAALRVATSRDLCAVEGVGEATANRVLLYVEENYPPPAGEPAQVTDEEQRDTLDAQLESDDALSRKTAGELSEILDGDGEDRVLPAGAMGPLVGPIDEDEDQRQPAGVGDLMDDILGGD